MTYKYLNKVADISDRLGTGVLGVGMGLGAQAGAGIMAQQPVKSLLREGGQTSLREVERLRGAMGFKGTTPSLQHLPEGTINRAMYIPKGKISNFMNAQYMKAMGVDPRSFHETARGTVVTPGSLGPGIAAHGLGYAHLRGSKLGRFIGRARVPGSYAPLAAIPMVAFSKDPDSPVAKAAPYVAAAGMSPILIDEFEASRRGLRGMRSAGYDRQALRAARRSMALAGSTYGLLAAAGIAAPIGIRQWRKRRVRRQEERTDR